MRCMQAWGSDNTSMRTLQTLDVNNCNLTGTLPPAWSQTLPALQEINASANALSGTSCQLLPVLGLRAGKDAVVQPWPVAVYPAAGLHCPSVRCHEHMID